jgi:KDO2-lipid IV(A) lauroyltransferase
LIPSARFIRSAIAVMRVTPPPIARGIAAAGGFLAWAFMRDRRETLLQNLANTAPDRTLAERRRLARRTFVNMAVTAVDLFRLPSISREALREMFEIRGLEHLDASQKLGKGTVLVTAHLGPYELASAFVASMGYPLHGMMENLEPDLLDALAAYRASTGMKLVNMKDGLRAAYRVLGEGQVLALVADRVVGDTKGTLAVPFGAGVRLMPTGPAVFAQATGAPVVTGFACRHPAGKPRYLIEIDPPIVPQGRDAADRDRIMQRIVERTAAAVGKHPDEWYVFQPNWVAQ